MTMLASLRRLVPKHSGKSEANRCRRDYRARSVDDASDGSDHNPNPISDVQLAQVVDQFNSNLAGENPPDDTPEKAVNFGLRDH